MTARITAFVFGGIALFIGMFFVSGETRLRWNGLNAEATLEGAAAGAACNTRSPATA